jgi:hypothetical protein
MRGTEPRRSRISIHFARTHTVRCGLRTSTAGSIVVVFDLAAE